jgi:hypothetical protein
MALSGTQTNKGNGVWVYVGGLRISNGVWVYVGGLRISNASALGSTQQ